MRTYENCVTVINAKRKTREEMFVLMDVYLLYGRITPDQYTSLEKLMDDVGLE